MSPATCSRVLDIAMQNVCQLHRLLGNYSSLTIYVIDMILHKLEMMLITSAHEL